MSILGADNPSMGNPSINNNNPSQSTPAVRTKASSEILQLIGSRMEIVLRSLLHTDGAVLVGNRGMRMAGTPVARGMAGNPEMQTLDPPVLALDHPTNGVDLGKGAQVVMQEVLALVRTNGVAVGQQNRMSFSSLCLNRSFPWLKMTS